MARDLLGNEMTDGDLPFFLFGITRERDHFETIQQGPGIVCCELAVVMNMTFERSYSPRDSGPRKTGSVPDPGPREGRWKDLRENPCSSCRSHRAGRPGLDRFRLLHGLDDFSGQRSDIGPAMTADLSLVAHATEGDLMKFRPMERAMERASEVLPTPGGPTRHRIGPWISRQTATARCSMIFSFTVFNQVILVQNLLGHINVDFLGPFGPRQVDHPIQIVTDDGRFSRHRGHHLQLLELRARLLGRLFGHSLALDRFSSSKISFLNSSRSPSSFWIACICSFR